MMFANKKGSMRFCFWIAILLIPSFQCKSDEKEKNYDSKSTTGSGTTRASNVPAECNFWCSVRQKAGAMGKIGLCIGIVSVAVIGGVTLTLPLMGFTEAGISAGSIAAAFQSLLLGGNINAGGLFAILQSLGVTGLSASVKNTIISTISTVCGVALTDSTCDQNTANSG